MFYIIVFVIIFVYVIKASAIKCYVYLIVPTFIAPRIIALL